METINIGQRKQIEFILNDKEVVMSLAVKNIQHFQEKNKMALPVALEEMQKNNIEVILNLMYSMISDKKTGRVLGEKFFGKFDELELLTRLTPLLTQLTSEEIPEAKGEAEKK